MLDKSICFKCHMKNYGVDGTAGGMVKCYPPVGQSERIQCENKFNYEWDLNMVWCFGIAYNATEEEMKQICGEKTEEMKKIGGLDDPFINPKTAFASKFCEYIEEQPRDTSNQ